MAEFLSKDTEAILKKYDQAKPFDNVNGIDFVAVDKKDLDFLLGYTEGSLVIEEDSREQIEGLKSELDKWKRAYHKIDPVGFTFNEPLKEK